MRRNASCLKDNEKKKSNPPCVCAIEGKNKAGTAAVQKRHRQTVVGRCKADGPYHESQDTRTRARIPTSTKKVTENSRPQRAVRRVLRSGANPTTASSAATTTTGKQTQTTTAAAARASKNHPDHIIKQQHSNSSTYLTQVSRQHQHKLPSTCSMRTNHNDSRHHHELYLYSLHTLRAARGSSG